MQRSTQTSCQVKNQRMRFYTNSCLSRVFELLSSAIQNFLPIPIIPLAPLAAILALICRINCFSVAFSGKTSSLETTFLASAYLPKISLSPFPFGSSFFHPLVPAPYFDSSVSFHAFSIISWKQLSSSIELDIILQYSSNSSFVTTWSGPDFSLILWATSNVSKNSKRIYSSVFLPETTSGCFLAL